MYVNKARTLHTGTHSGTHVRPRAQSVSAQGLRLPGSCYRRPATARSTVAGEAAAVAPAAATSRKAAPSAAGSQRGRQQQSRPAAAWRRSTAPAPPPREVRPAVAEASPSRLRVPEPAPPPRPVLARPRHLPPAPAA